MSYFTSTIPITTLSKPVSPRSVQYLFEDEDKYYAAYQAKLDTAKALGGSGFYFDGIYYLNMSSECFLKYFFCLIRSEVYRIKPLSPLDEAIPHDYDTAFLFARNKLPARSFGHNLSTITRFINKFSDAYSYTEFQKYIRHLKSGEIWINDRYESKKQILFKGDYDDYLLDFENLLNGCCTGIK